MSFSYTAAGTTAVDQARLLIGDTLNTATQPCEFQDEEIAALNTLLGDSIYGLAAALCDALAAKYAGSVQTSAAGVSAQLQQRHAQYLAMAERYRAMAKTGGKAVLVIAPFAGGTEDQTGRPPIF